MGRPWYGSKWVRVGGAVLVLLVLGALATPFLIPVDSYRPLLVSAIESATGRQIQIDSLKLYFVPTVHVSIANFRMQNPPGFPAGNALVATSIDLGIAPRALLSGHLDVTYIVPVGVQVNVLRDAGGRTNFAVPVPVRNAAPSRPSAFILEHIASVNLNDAALTFADVPSREPPVSAFALTGVSGTIGSIDAQAPDWAKKLDIVADLRNARLTTVLLTEPVDFHSGALAFKGGAGKATFAASLGSFNLSGSASIAKLDPLSIAFSVAGPKLDLNVLARLVRPNAKAIAGAPTAHTLLAHGTIKFDNVVFAPLEASHLSGQLNVYASAVRLNASTLSAYGGSILESAALDGSAGVPVSVSVQVHGIDVQRALAALGLGSKPITGTLDGNFNLRTLLANNPKQALAGAGTFAVRNGSFPGLNFESQLVQAARLMGLNVPSDSRFSFFGGDLHVAQERGSSNNLKLLATAMQAMMRGNFTFDQALDYSGTAVLAVTRSAPSTSSSLSALAQQLLSSALQSNIGVAHVLVPFALRGTLNKPQFSLVGTPQPLITAGQPRAAQLPAKSPTMQDLLQLIPGLQR